MNEQGQIRHETAQAVWRLTWDPDGFRIERQAKGGDRALQVFPLGPAGEDWAAAIERLRTIPSGSTAWLVRKLEAYAEQCEADDARPMEAFTPPPEPAPEPAPAPVAKPRSRRGKVRA
jgi:YD repeat-containing protein